MFYKILLRRPAHRRVELAADGRLFFLARHGHKSFLNLELVGAGRSADL